ncbi:MAG: 3'-5' exonuclease, partial [Mariprofundaceae bacterium]|nr:3'-5' exonuclease [Mariprofundaceae bacterium]
MRHILEFERIWQGAQIHRLEENYRSSNAILQLANAIIRDNPDRHGKMLRTTRGEGDVPAWKVCDDEYDEARQVLAWLKQRRDHGVAWSEMAVLYRSNRQSLPFEQIFREADIPYRMIGGVGFFERMEIKDALAYWAMLNRCGDGLQLLRICNKPRRGIGAKGQEEIAAQLNHAGLRAGDWLDTIAAGQAIGAARKLTALARLMADMRQRSEAMPDRGLMPVLEESGYLDSLKALGQLEYESRLENIQTLQRYIKLTLAEGATPIEFMDRAALLQSGEERQDEDDCVSLMSLHRAKGLEFDTVAVTGVEEGLLPHQRAVDEGEAGISEERRLLYVGIT